MTTDQVVQYANRGDLAGPDMRDSLGIELRRHIIPQFFRDIDQLAGTVFWRRATASLSLVNPTRNYNLPTDFEWMEKLELYNTAGSQYWPDFKYIGEDPEQVLLCEATTTVSRPSAWYVVAGSGVPWAVRVNTIPDGAYTARGVYRRTINWADDTTPVDLDSYIPSQSQWALVHLLRAEIYGDRFGIGDSRQDSELEKYKTFVAGVASQKEAAARNHVRTVT